MTDVIVRGIAVRWAADDFPGWIEVNLVDGAGRSHRVVEKVPVLTTENITASSAFPLELWMRAEFQHLEDGVAWVRFAHSVETTERLGSLGMPASDVRWL